VTGRIRRTLGAVGLAALATLAAAQEAPRAAALDPAFVVGAPKGQPLAGTALDKRTEEVGGLLRCPVCQGLSVAASPSTMASNMKAEVRSLLASGYTEEQVLAYFERSYGEFVRLQPPLRGVNWLVWLGPVAGLLAGGATVFLALRRSSAAAPATPTDALPARDTLPADDALAAAVRRIRERAYGWPGGLPPRADPR
jgi:cytochrome c-type biogenesis protein CcmH